jgi:PleD family two-component response regulator
MTDDIEDLDNTRQLPRLDLPVAPSVLIVDDDDLVLAHLQELVVAAGYRVFTATNGSQAMRRLNALYASKSGGRNRVTLSSSQAMALAA